MQTTTVTIAGVELMIGTRYTFGERSGVVQCPDEFVEELYMTDGEVEGPAYIIHPTGTIYHCRFEFAPDQGAYVGQGEGVIYVVGHCCPIFDRPVGSVSELRPA